jgi:hypothetical protein
MNKAAAELGRKGGKAKTEAKASAARQNGQKGGRPPIIRTRRQIEAARLQNLLADTRHGNLAPHAYGASADELVAFRAWEAGGPRQAAIDEQLANIQRRLDGIPEDAVILTRGSDHEMRHYLHAAGVTVEPWYERLPGFPASVPAGMGGYEYVADGAPISHTEAAERARIAPHLIPPQPPEFLAERKVR